MTTERYEKPAELLAEWEGLGTTADLGFLDRLSRASLETAVTARRIYGKGAWRDSIDAILVERVEPRLAAEASKMAKGYGGLYQEEIEDEIIDGFWQDILDGESFFEIRFNLALHRLGQTARRKVLEGKQRKRERTATRIGVGGEEADESDEVAEEKTATKKQLSYEETGFKQIEDRERALAVLAQMPPEMAKAMILHFMMDIKIYSKDPNEQTVASELGCGERKARELVADGLALARRLLEGENDE